MSLYGVMAGQVGLPGVGRALGLRVNRMWFDIDSVREAVAVAERKNLEKFGAFVRRKARSLIRKTKKAVSQPNEPPRSHSEEPNIRTILFAYEPQNHTVVIGPAFLNGRAGSTVRGIVPQVLEHGGEITVLEHRLKGLNGPWRRGALHRLGDQETRTRTIRIKKRPYMLPSLEAEIDNFPDLWRSSVRGRAA